MFYCKIVCNIGQYVGRINNVYAKRNKLVNTLPLLHLKIKKEMAFMTRYEIVMN